MRLTIIADDGAIYKDNEHLDGIKFTNIPKNFHALQWNGTEGEIEYKVDANRIKADNEIINQLPSWVDDCLADMEIKKQEILDAVSIPVVAPAGTIKG